MGFVDLHGGLGRRYGSLGLALERPFHPAVPHSRGAQRTSVQGPDAARATRYAKMLAQHFDLPSGVRIDILGCDSPTRRARFRDAARTQRRHRHGGGSSSLDAGSLEIATVLGRGASDSGLGLGLFEQGGFVVDGGSAGGYAPPPIITRLAFPRRVAPDARVRPRLGKECTERRSGKPLPRFPAFRRPMPPNSAGWC